MSLIATTQAALKQQFFTSDTGAGGLNATGIQQVREWFRIDDPTYERNRTGSRPTVMTEVVELPDDGFTIYGAALAIRIHLFTQRDLPFANLNAVVARIETLAKAAGGMVLADTQGTGWQYTPIQYQRLVRMQASNDLMYNIVELIANADKP